MAVDYSAFDDVVRRIGERFHAYDSPALRDRLVMAVAEVRAALDQDLNQHVAESPHGITDPIRAAYDDARTLLLVAIDQPEYAAMPALERHALRDEDLDPYGLELVRLSDVMHAALVRALPKGESDGDLGDSSHSEP